MAGSPKKRARRQAARRAQDQQQAAANTGVSPQSAPDGETPAPAASELQHVGTAPKEPGDSASDHSAEGSKDLTAAATPITVSAVPVVQGELVTPGDPAEPTRTALKRAMRARAQEHAEKAIAVLVETLTGADKKEARAAANDLLAWGFGKPATEIEAGEGAQLIVIRKFGETV